MILAAGCSIAHGQGNVEENYHKDNVNDSYPNLIASYMKLECNNIAYPGYSNELIFHSIINELDKNLYSHCLVSWTGNTRDGWENSDEIYTFNLNYAKYENKHKLGKTLWHQIENHISFGSNDVTGIDKIKKLYSTVETKILSDDFSKKLKNYQQAVQAICQAKSIHLVEIDAIKNNEDSKLYLLDRKLFYNPKSPWFHPPKESHKLWADDIYNKFYAK